MCDKKIKINYADIGGCELFIRFIESILIRLGYDLIISDTPDFLICGDYLTKEFLKYDCVRIYLSGECEFPDLNLYDYAISSMNYSVGDRHLRWPFYLWRDGSRREIDLALNKHKLFPNTERKFCNYLVSNETNANPFRNILFNKLCEYKCVDSGGRSNNNIGRIVDDKYGFQKNYKFSLVCENTSYPGYITEKIVEAWMAGTIPIYWGAPDIAEEFNESAFINCGRYNNINDIISFIKKIDCDDGLYKKMMLSPISGNGLI